MDGKAIAQKAGAFIRSALSESDGTVSSTRCVIAVIVAFSLGWITSLLCRIHGPLTLADVSGFVGPVGMYVASICGALYGVNRFAGALENRNDDDHADDDNRGDDPKK